MRNLAKLHGDQSSRGWDITIFRLFENDGHPPSWICYSVFGPPTMSIRWLLVMCKIWPDSVQYFRQYACFSIVRVRLEMGILEYFTPLIWEQSTRPQNGTSLRGNTSHGVYIVKIRLYGCELGAKNSDSPLFSMGGFCPRVKNAKGAP